MLKVLVAEDEPPLLRGICRIIQSANSRFEVVSSCANGEEAIQFLQQNPDMVDVIVTDIYMPIKTGLDLLDYVRDTKINCEVVLLTGYQEFQYVQHALRQKAYDYVLKPIKKDSLLEVLNRLHSHAFQKREDEFYQALVQLLYLNNPQPLSLLQPLTQLNSPLAEATQYRLFFFCAGSYPVGETVPYKEDGAPYAALYEEFQQQFANSNNWIMKYNLSRERIGLFRAQSMEKAEEIANSLFSLGKAHPMPVSVFVSPIIDDWKNLHKIYISTRKIAADNMIFSQAALHFCESEKDTQKNDYALPSHLKNKLLYGFEENNYSEISDGITTMLDNVKKAKITQKNLECLLQQIAYQAHNSMPEPKKVFSLTSSALNEIISSTIDYDTLKSEYTKLLCSNFSSKNQDIASLRVEQIAAYIKQNMAENLSTHTLSCKFNITSSYLAKIFKDYSGYTPVEYITLQRIEKAKQLLLSNSELKAKDVAWMVGYTDALYFSRLFKKATGFAPSEYREQI